ncbi:MAG: hypothetical protein LBH13_06465 [Cellulomonadaceae bacterium]|jgi:hypothetical protein|nr:hypothetical protein [Cellulomonadaceae bacterium]
MNVYLMAIIGLTAGMIITSIALGWSARRSRARLGALHRALALTRGPAGKPVPVDVDAYNVGDNTRWIPDPRVNDMYSRMLDVEEQCRADKIRLDAMAHFNNDLRLRIEAAILRIDAVEYKVGLTRQNQPRREEVA